MGLRRRMQDSGRRGSEVVKEVGIWWSRFLIDRKRRLLPRNKNVLGALMLFSACVYWKAYSMAVVQVYVKKLDT